MSDINYDRLLFAAFFTPFGKHPVSNEVDWGARLVFRGPPGASKTASLRRLAHKVGASFYSLKPGAKGDGGFGVTPVPMTHDGRTVLTFPVPDWVEHLNAQKCALVACDELNTAPPAIQAAQLGLLQEKEIGSGHLGPRVRLIGATNETEDAAGGWDLAPAVANRLGHVIWPDPDAAKLSQFLISGANVLGESHVDSTAEEKRVIEAWPEAWSTAAGAISAFLQARADMVRRQPKGGDPKASGAWPSPRTWEYACRAMASAKVHNLPEEERDVFIGSFIGEGPSGELATWLSDKDLPDPVAVLEGMAKFKHEPARLDRTCVFLNSCVALVTPKNAENRNERAGNLWKILGHVAQDSQDLVVPAAHALRSAGLVRLKEAKKVLAELKDLLMVVVATS